MTKNNPSLESIYNDLADDFADRPDGKIAVAQTDVRLNKSLASGALGIVDDIIPEPDSVLDPFLVIEDIRILLDRSWKASLHLDSATKRLLAYRLIAVQQKILSVFEATF